ncbi:zinc finger protein, putative (macronuclear) [Tetrahymena thermophila SB210]|uniref:Zinc finger protein, putative n=1 Tax=Tetrahymena thermophila (strain SB210) TaxID=312017 RepID=Q22P70_TETTS|nr:zinc finger protein, putative [Tetrahymena thermophila SB210]EAR86941.2 zinc finger protein, putative [Tetrahymena thermophila SB210]|eukprot:XP_001007186.2 zinc finger protein, putative [Tetrahymena thermophila SB210]
MNNYYRQGVDNSCKEKCGLGMYINQKTNTCDICSVLGCDQCLQNQRCIKCTDNLKLDEKSGCLLNDNTCDQQQYYSLFQKQCSYQCSKNEIKDQNTQLCVPIQNCNYFQEMQKKDFFQSISVQTFIDNGFLLMGDSTCQFYLYNLNLETVYSNLLVQNPLDKTIVYGSSNFYDRNVGGCQTKQKLIGFNFLTYKIEFEISNEFNIFYSLYQLDVENHLLVLQKNQGVIYIFFNI